MFTNLFFHGRQYASLSYRITCCCQTVCKSILDTLYTHILEFGCLTYLFSCHCCSCNHMMQPESDIVMSLTSREPICFTQQCLMQRYVSVCFISPGLYATTGSYTMPSRSTHRLSHPSTPVIINVMSHHAAAYTLSKLSW